tara:strand:+ start:1508 stop:1678 length:171 start_codon:yes stop_codon:yes gene_type:complete
MAEQQNGKGDRRRKGDSEKFQQNYSLVFDKFDLEFFLPHEEEEKKPKKSKKSKDKS